MSASRGAAPPRRVDITAAARWLRERESVRVAEGVDEMDYSWPSWQYSRERPSELLDEETPSEPRQQVEAFYKKIRARVNDVQSSVLKYERDEDQILHERVVKDYFEPEERKALYRELTDARRKLTSGAIIEWMHTLGSGGVQNVNYWSRLIDTQVKDIDELKAKLESVFVSSRRQDDESAERQHEAEMREQGPDERTEWEKMHDMLDIPRPER